VEENIERLGGMHPDLDEIISFDELEDRLWKENMCSLKKLATQFYVMPQGKLLPQDEMQLKKILVPALASFFMTRLGYTQAKAQLSKYEY